MTSPFPGMDPYLESPTHWPDFHDRFINTVCEVIADTLPDAYFARIQEEVLLVEPEPPTFKIGPDVVVGRDDRESSHREAGVVTLAPTTLQNVVSLDARMIHYVEIIRFPDAQVVTIVEVLSPSNKQSERLVYATKRDRILRSDELNFVEIDLLRAGHRIELNKPLPPAHYYAFVSRSDRRPDCDVYHWSVRDSLPKIPIPLRPGTPNASADLAEAFAMAYKRGRYRRMVRYDQPPPPPNFNAIDLEWVARTASQRSM